MLSCGGIAVFLLGFFLLWLSRSDDDMISRICLILGLALCGMGLWFALFETGEGLARFLPFLEP